MAIAASTVPEAARRAVIGSRLPVVPVRTVAVNTAWVDRTGTACAPFALPAAQLGPSPPHETPLRSRAGGTLHCDGGTRVAGQASRCEARTKSRSVGRSPASCVVIWNRIANSARVRGSGAVVGRPWHSARFNRTQIGAPAQPHGPGGSGRTGTHSAGADHPTLRHSGQPLTRCPLDQGRRFPTAGITCSPPHPTSGVSVTDTEAVLATVILPAWTVRLAPSSRPQQPWRVDFSSLGNHPVGEEPDRAHRTGQRHRTPSPAGWAPSRYTRRRTAGSPRC